MEKTILELNNVWKVYDGGSVEVQALRGVSLKIRQGEFVAIVGASGSGKSTMLSITGCLDTPSKGKVFLDGIDTGSLDESMLARIRGKKIGFVFQAFNLHPTLSVLENIALPMRIHEMPEDEIESTSRKLIEKVGLGHREKHLPAQLSGGEKQRAAIARALSTSPSIVLADEPTGNLDSKIGVEILSIFDDLHRKEERTIILVTHDQSVSAHAERIVTLSDGKILSDTKKQGGKRK